MKCSIKDESKELKKVMVKIKSISLFCKLWEGATTLVLNSVFSSTKII